MKVTYDPEVDVLKILLHSVASSVIREDQPKYDTESSVKAKRETRVKKGGLHGQD